MRSAPHLPSSRSWEQAIDAAFASGGPLISESPAAVQNGVRATVAPCVLVHPPRQTHREASRQRSVPISVSSSTASNNRLLRKVSRKGSNATRILAKKAEVVSRSPGDFTVDSQQERAPEINVFFPLLLLIMAICLSLLLFFSSFYRKSLFMNTFYWKPWTLTLLCKTVLRKCRGVKV